MTEVPYTSHTAYYHQSNAILAIMDENPGQWLSSYELMVRSAGTVFDRIASDEVRQARIYRVCERMTAAGILESHLHRGRHNSMSNHYRRKTA